MKRAELQAYSTEAQAALRFFLSHVALPDKRKRYLDLISRPNSRRKFLNTVYHELELHLNTAMRVESLSPRMLRMSGYRFQPYDDVFGDPVGTLASVVASFDESFLVVSADGKVGIHGPESFIDKRAYYIV